MVMPYKDLNDSTCQAWIEKTLATLPRGWRILECSGGGLIHQKHCTHLDYGSHDLCPNPAGSELPDSRHLSGLNLHGSRVEDGIRSVQEPDGSFDAILCSELLEHLPDPTLALDEFKRLLKPGGKLILTAPFSSLVHGAPYHYYTGFTRYWFEHHLGQREFLIDELIPNGDWFTLLAQDLTRLGSMAKQSGTVTWPLAYIYAFLGMLYFRLSKRNNKKAEALASFGWQCVALNN